MASRLPPLSGIKDVRDYPIFAGALSRWTFRLYTEPLTRAGQWFFWISGVITSYGAASLELQGYVVFSYVAGLWIIALLVLPLFRPKVKLNVEHAQRICAGEVLPVDVEIEQKRRLVGADLVLLPYRLPRLVDCEQVDGVPLGILKRGRKTRVRMGLLCGRRGSYLLHGYRVATDFPFGLMRSFRTFKQDRSLLVYPKFTRLTRLQLPVGHRHHPGGVALASNIGESFEFIGDREYRDGDNIRDIDWRATGRVGKLIVREYVDEYFMRVAVVLDTHVAKRAPETAREAFERAVSVAAAVADYMARQEYLVDIFAAGPNLYHLTAGRSLAYLDQILDILACVESNPEEPFEIIEPEMSEYLSKITTVICVFLDWNENRRDFVERLVRQGAGVKVIIVRDEKCSLPPIPQADLVGSIPVIGQKDFEAGIEEL